MDRSSCLTHEDILKQLHHRVKNNLQVICSLLRLQAHYSPDEATRMMFRNSEQRIRSMALVHEKLCKHNDPSAVQFDEYVIDLVSQLLKSRKGGGARPRVEFQLEGIRLSIEQAVPCGLLLNELISNSLQHGCVGDSPALRVGMRRSGDEVELFVEDCGPGLPQALDPESPGTLGLKVVQALGRQLGATLSFGGNHGFHLRVRFPYREPPQAHEDTTFVLPSRVGAPY